MADPNVFIINNDKHIRITERSFNCYLQEFTKSNI